MEPIRLGNNAEHPIYAHRVNHEYKAAGVMQDVDLYFLFNLYLEI